MKNIRKYILSCIDMENPYASKYVREVEYGDENEGVTHHIVPVYFFKKVLNIKKLRVKGTDKRRGSVDMQPENLMIISKARHLVMHYYLYKSSVVELRDSAMNAFAFMFENGGMETISCSKEYSHLLDEMKMEYDTLVETGRYVKHKFIVKGRKYEANGMLPKIAYSITLPNPNRTKAIYYGRILQDGKETRVKLYERRDLSEIWLNRVSRVYAAAMESIERNGTVDENILSNVVTVENAHEIYQRFLPVPFNKTEQIPYIYYGICRPQNGRKYFRLRVFENGVKRTKTLPVTTESDAMKILARIRGVYEDARSIDKAGFPVPEYIKSSIVYPETKDISAYLSDTFMPFLNSPSPIPMVKTETIASAMEKWEISMRKRGLKNRSIDVIIRNVCSVIDKSMLVRDIDTNVISNILENISGSSSRIPETKYRQITNLRTFMKFVASEYDMPAKLIEICYIDRKSLKCAA